MLVTGSEKKIVLGSMVGGVGGFCGLMIESLAVIWNPLPLLILGSSITFAAFLAFLLPETKDEALPETIEDSLKLGQKKSIQNIINLQLQLTTYSNPMEIRE